MRPDFVLAIEAGGLLHVDEHRPPLEAGVDTHNHRRLRDVFVRLTPPVTTNGDLYAPFDWHAFGIRKLFIAKSPQLGLGVVVDPDVI